MFVLFCVYFVWSCSHFWCAFLFFVRYALYVCSVLLFCCGFVDDVQLYCVLLIFSGLSTMWTDYLCFHSAFPFGFLRAAMWCFGFVGCECLCVVVLFGELL